MKKKLTILLVALLLLSLAVTGGVLAALHAQTEPVQNTFTSVDFPDVYIEEAFNDGSGEEKSDVSVKVKNLYTPVYVRAAIVCYLAEKNTDTTYTALGKQPVENTDYTLTLYTGDTDDWVQKDDGYYYYKKVLEPDGGKAVYTSDLIKSCTTLCEDARLCVDVLAQVIQVGHEEEAWGRAFNGGAWE